MYANQPSVRSVVDYIATSSAQLGLKLYKRVDDDERERDESHPAAQTVSHPDDTTPAGTFMFGMFCDFLVYDNAYALKFRSPGATKRVLKRYPRDGDRLRRGAFGPTSTGCGRSTAPTWT
jgi:phage portal protein BeeE